MKMAYNPYNDSYNIYNLGKQYSDIEEKKKKYNDLVNKFNGLGQVTDGGLSNRQEEIKKKATQYYGNLKSNGYGNIANQLQSSDSATRKNITNSLSRIGKTGVRNYLKSLGGQYGLSNEDIDNNLKYDNTTGEISFYGKNFGRPMAVDNGVSYADENTLNNQFTNTMKALGINKNENFSYNQDMDSSSDMYKQGVDFMKNEYGTNKADDNKKVKNGQEMFDNFMAAYNQNALTTPEAKELYSVYGAKGNEAAYGAVADSASSNSGNIDSFAQANAKRQQLAFTNAATEQILDNVYKKLSLLGVQMDNQRNLESGYSDKAWTGMNTVADQYTKSAEGLNKNANDRFTNIETRKQNDTNISRTNADTNYRNAETEALMSGISGKVSNTVLDRDNPFLESGKLIDKNKDYSALKAEYMLKSTQTDDPQMKEYWYTQAEYADRAGSIKTQDPKYAQFASNFGGYRPKQTEDGRQFDENTATTKYQVDAGLTATLGQAAAEKEAAYAQAEATNDHAAMEYNLGLQGLQNNKDIVDADNETKVKVAEIENDGNTTVSDAWINGNTTEGGNTTGNAKEQWNTFVEYFPDEKVVKFLNEKLKPYFDNGWEINEERLENLIAGTDVKNSNSTTYDIDVEDAKAICDSLGLDSTWINKYTNRTWFNSGKGMKSTE